MSDALTDNRFKLISKAKELLIESTNINDSPNEMAVLDDILFRCWQMGWLNTLESLTDEGVVMDKSEVKVIEDRIAKILEKAADDYNESIKTDDQELATAYACRSMAASVFVIAAIKALGKEYLYDCD